MSFSVSISLDIEGDRSLFERVPERLRDATTLMRRIGVYVGSRAVERLETVLEPESEARTGLLMGSMRFGESGSGGNEHSIFEVGEDFASVGTNLPYAAQVQFGGTILPRNAKALAIPLPAELKRPQQSPRDLDPNRELLRFVPITGGASGNVFALLVDDEGELGFGKGKALFALASSVTQKPRPFLFVDVADQRFIVDRLYPEWLGL